MNPARHAGRMNLSKKLPKGAQNIHNNGIFHIILQRRKPFA